MVILPLCMNKLVTHLGPLRNTSYSVRKGYKIVRHLVCQSSEVDVPV